MVNLISALDDDDVIMREVSTNTIDEMTYGQNFPREKYLKTGLLLFEEKLDNETRESLAHTNQKKIDQVEPTRVILQVVKRLK
jgi:hypothetical protein